MHNVSLIYFFWIFLGWKYAKHSQSIVHYSNGDTFLRNFYVMTLTAKHDKFFWLMRQTAAAQSLKSSRVRESAETDHILRHKMSFQIPPFAIRSFMLVLPDVHTNSPSFYLQLQKVFELNLKVHTYFKHDTPCKIKLYKVRKGETTYLLQKTFFGFHCNLIW